jgi:hypothetical protein
MPREYTRQECVDMLMEHFMTLVKYWATIDGSKEWVLDGLLHSILCTLDGVSGDMPAFDLVPCPHSDDKQYNIDNEDNYWPEELHINDETYLHEIMNKYR